ncbi:MAG: glycosyltransferase family 1 protein [Planctomycetes bacterium]|nr:glycosyltransferase family 1 protein [Planctomycetota bacterium]
MKIVILTSYGTRGDVQPYLALALRLKDEGHEVTVVAGLEHASFIQERRIHYVPMRINVREILQSERCREYFYGEGREKKDAIKEWGKALSIHLPEILDDIWAASQGADCLIYPPTLYSAWHIADKLKIPSIISFVVPVVSVTGSFPALMLKATDSGRFFNRLSHRIIILMITQGFRSIVSQWCRNTLKVKPPSRFKNYLSRNSVPVPVLYCYSPKLLPMPYDWNDTTLSSGYWFLERQESWKPSTELESFLSKGPPPVYIGFGSTPTGDHERINRVILSALRQSGERGIICLGETGMTAQEQYDFVHYEDQVPFDWLFPRVKAIVNHGGSGTLAFGLRAGKPGIVCPFTPEQTFWGYQINRLNAGPPPLHQIPREDFTAERLSEAIKLAVNDPTILKGAEDLGKAIRNEDGLGKAVKFIHTQIEAFSNRKK